MGADAAELPAAAGAAGRPAAAGVVRPTAAGAPNGQLPTTGAAAPPRPRQTAGRAALRPATPRPVVPQVVLPTAPAAVPVGTGSGEQQ